MCGFRTIKEPVCKSGFILLLILVLASSALAVDPIPEPQGMVSDFAGVLAVAEREALRDKVKRLKDETGFEIAVATVKTTSGEPPFDYSMRMIRQWGVGDKERGGALFLVMTEDRQISVRVSTHGEATITDSQAGQARDAAKPYFKKGQWAAGLNAGVDLLISRVREAAGNDPTLQNPEVKPNQKPSHTTAEILIGLAIFFIPIIIVFIVVGIFSLVIVQIVRQASKPKTFAPNWMDSSTNYDTSTGYTSISDSSSDSSSSNDSSSSSWSSSDSSSSDSSFGGDSSSGGGADGGF
jgi:uncharacterized protein